MRDQTGVVAQCDRVDGMRGERHLRLEVDHDERVVLGGQQFGAGGWGGGDGHGGLLGMPAGNSLQCATRPATRIERLSAGLKIVIALAGCHAPDAPGRLRNNFAMGCKNCAAGGGRHPGTTESDKGQPAHRSGAKCR
ncbi:hypothetical protein G6F22_012887 [Rhizopus arrhizus]|nr:hypothetical protein G6F22_012887 [Rhizopus arrhizus]